MNVHKTLNQLVSITTLLIHKSGYSPFVLIYEISEEKNMATLVDFDHHDKIYKA